MRGHLRPRFLAVVATVLLGIEGGPALAQAPVKPAQPGRIRAEVTRQTSVRRDPKPDGELLGNYRPGTTLMVFISNVPGWFRINFPREVKGTRIGWVPIADLAIVAADGTRIAPARGRGGLQTPGTRPSDSPTAGAEEEAFKLGRTSVGFVTGLGLLGLGDYKTYALETKSLLMSPRFGFDVQHQAGDSIGASLQLLYSMGKTTTLSVSGIEAHLRVHYDLWSKKRLRLGLAAGPMVGYYSVETTQSTVVVNTSGIISVGGYLGVQAGMAVGRRWSLGMGLGYQLLKLPEVFVADPGPPLSADGVSDINLSGLGVQLAIRFHL